MNQRSAWRTNAIGGIAAAALLGSGGCSLLYDFNTNQCNETQDCINQGPQFNYSICVNHVCVQTAGEITGGAPAATGGARAGGTRAIGGALSSGGVGGLGGSQNIGGTPSIGGTAAGGTPASTDTSLTGGSEPGGGVTGAGGIMANGGVPAAGGASSTGGATPAGGTQTGGTSNVTGCTSHAQCIKENVDQPFICKSGTCVKLTSKSCPVMIPAASALTLLKEQSPIIVGGFAKLTNPSEPHSSLSVVNWDLAFDEFNTRLNPGLPSYTPGGAFRPFVGVVCQGYVADGGTKDIPGAMSLLVDQIGVTSIISSMGASDLLTAWNYTAASQNVFFMNTGSADLKLVTTSNGGMLWHMLGDPHVMATSIVALFRQMAPYVYKQRLLNYQTNGTDNPDASPLKVAIVYTSTSSMVDMHDVLVSTGQDHPESRLSFNGKTWTENTVAGNTLEALIPVGAPNNDPAVVSAISRIQGFVPHIVFALGSDEIASVIGPVEGSWSTTTQEQIRPYYLFSQLLYNNTTTFPPMVPLYASKNPPLDMRMAGVNYAQAQDSRSQENYLAYLNRLRIANPGPGLQLEGSENYYDAAYYLLYSIAAAAARRNGTPSAADILAGLTTRVINTTAGVPVNVDPQQISTVVSKFFSSEPYYMALWGTMGYPTFDPLLGTRIVQTSAWCYPKSSSGSYSYAPDGLFYDATSHLFSPNSKGIPTCLQNYCPQDADAGVGTCPESY